MKVGMIGVGNIFETVHHRYFSKIIGIEIVAVVDAYVDKAKAMAEKYNIPHFFATAKEMLDALEIDIVVVATPNKYHHENVMLALEKGCNVLCEKPPGISAREAYEMYSTAQKQNKILAYNLHYRFAKEVMLLKSQMATLGKVYNTKVYALRRLGIPGWGNFINKELQGGGPLIDIGVHMLDTALYLLGYPKVVDISAVSYQEIGNKKSRGSFGSWDPKKYQVEDSLFAMIKFEGKSSMILETAFALNIKEKSIMNCLFRGAEKGASLFPLEIYEAVDGELMNTTLPYFTSDEDNHRRCIEDFVSICRGNKGTIADAQTGWQLQKLIEDIYTAAGS